MVRESKTSKSGNEEKNMILVPIYNIAKEKVGEMELNSSVFNASPRLHLLHEIVRMQLNKKRRGTACAKERNAIRGGGKKPWRQKGTGRARSGTSRSPIWPGGGVTFGPKPRSYEFMPPKKVRKGALKVALSLYLRDNKLTVLDSFELSEVKTKNLLQILNKWEMKKTLIVDKKDNNNLKLSVRNLSNHDFLPPEGINVYDILNHKEIMITKEAIKFIENSLLN